MDGIWDFLKDPESRAILGWIGGCAGAIAAATWAVFIYLRPPKSNHSLEDMDERTSTILDILSDLEERAKTCLAHVVEIKDPYADETTSGTLAANVPSQEEYRAVCDAILEYAKSVRGKEPTPEEWQCHLDHLGSLREKGEQPKTQPEGFQDQLQWIRSSRIFVQRLAENRLEHEVE